MSIFNTIKSDMYDAMKAREKVKSNALRIVLSKIKPYKKEPIKDTIKILFK